MIRVAKYKSPLPRKHPWPCFFSTLFLSSMLLSALHQSSRRKTVGAPMDRNVGRPILISRLSRLRSLNRSSTRRLQPLLLEILKAQDVRACAICDICRRCTFVFIEDTVVIRPTLQSRVTEGSEEKRFAKCHTSLLVMKRYNFFPRCGATIYSNFIWKFEVLWKMSRTFCKFEEYINSSGRSRVTRPEELVVSLQ
jgi:hypothetical protein